MVKLVALTYVVKYYACIKNDIFRENTEITENKIHIILTT